MYIGKDSTTVDLVNTGSSEDGDVKHLINSQLWQSAVGEILFSDEDSDEWSPESEALEDDEDFDPIVKELAEQSSHIHNRGKPSLPRNDPG